MKSPRTMRQSVFFDQPIEADDGYGGVTTDWSFGPDSYAARVSMVHQRGSETVEADRLTGRTTYKVRLRQSSAARRITTDWRMRDARSGTLYNLRSIDTITDPHWIWVTVEGGVST